MGADKDEVDDSESVVCEYIFLFPAIASEMLLELKLFGVLWVGDVLLKVHGYKENVR